MSSIYLNGEFWYYRTELTDSAGQRVRVQRSLRTRDRKEGLRRQRELDTTYAEKEFHLSPRVTLSTAIADFLSHRQQLRSQGELTTNTIRSDVGSLRVFSRYYESSGLKYLNEFEDRDRAREILEGFLTVRRVAGIAPNTVRRDLRHVSGFFSFYVQRQRRLLQFNPVSVVTLPKQTKQGKFPSQSDWLKLRTHLRSRAATSQLSLQESVLWLQTETGARVGEMLRLKWDRQPTDVVGSGESWSVLEQGCSVIRMYSKRRERVVPLKSLARGQLTEFLSHRRKHVSSAYVFPSKVTGRPLNLSQFSRSFRKLLKEVGVERYFGTHGIRHGFISYVLNSGVTSDQVGWLVGHSSSEITRLYSHTDLATQARVFSALD